jgi:hypothetical protein
MTKRQAFLVDGVVGCLLTWGSVPLMEALGVGDRIQAVVAMLGLATTCLMLGVISEHFRRKEERSDRN